MRTDLVSADELRTAVVQLHADGMYPSVYQVTRFLGLARSQLTQRETTDVRKAMADLGIPVSRRGLEFAINYLRRGKKQ
jgi:hypothetical protein